jgi:hypothetical protein
MADFRGGDKLASRLKAIAEKLSQPKTLRVGFLEGATYPDGQSVAMVAALDEFGHQAPNGEMVGPWPFFRNMVHDESPSWAGKIARGMKANNYDVDKTLGQVGEDVKGALRQSIIDTNSPPLKPATIARKGFSTPLIHTSHMLNSVDSEIVSSSGD